MLETPGTLPSDPDELRAVAEQLRDLARSQALKIEKLEHQLAGHRKARFGSKSESADQLHLDLQEETEIAAAAADQQGEAGDEQIDDDTPGKRKHSRAPLPDHLERRSEVLSPGETCSDCGGTLRTLGEDVTQELDYIPGGSWSARSSAPGWPAPVARPSRKRRCQAAPSPAGAPAPACWPMCWSANIAIIFHCTDSPGSSRARRSICIGRH